jgi:AcrR family transcriptional regulator
MPAKAASAAPAKRDEIIDAALALFRARGLAAVSTRDLAEHAGLSRSHVYHYFTDWNALRLAAFEKFAQSEIEALQKAVERLPPPQALAAFVRFCLPAKPDAAWTLWVDAWSEAVHDDALAASYVEALRTFEEVLRGIVAQGCEAGVFAPANAERAVRQIAALTNGYADELLLEPSAKSARAAQEEILHAAGVLLNAQ